MKLLALLLALSCQGWAGTTFYPGTLAAYYMDNSFVDATGVYGDLVPTSSPGFVTGSGHTLNTYVWGQPTAATRLRPPTALETAFDNLAAFSVVLDVYRVNKTANDTFMFFTTATNDVIDSQSTGFPSIRFYNHGFSIDGSSTVIQSGSWYEVVVSGNSTNKWIYVNGVQVATAASDGRIDLTGLINIGSYPGGATPLYMCRVRFMNTAFTSAPPYPITDTTTGTGQLSPYMNPKQQRSNFVSPMINLLFNFFFKGNAYALDANTYYDQRFFNAQTQIDQNAEKRKKFTLTPTPNKSASITPTPDLSKPTPSPTITFTPTFTPTKTP